MKCILFIATISLFSCKKKEVEKVEEKPIEFSYEVNCNNCDISYTDMSNQTKIIRANSGAWTYKINTKVTFELKLSIRTALLSSQSIQAYILKDGEVVYGSLGYNSADISYHAISGHGTSSFGSFISTGTGSGAENGSGGSTTTPPTSSVCGARNKTGGYCKRVVIGGGRCWQHK